MDGKQIMKIVDARMVELGMTQKELAERLGVQSSAITAWRRSGSTPRPEKIIKLEEILGISFSDYETSEPLDSLREDLRILLRSAKDLPPSSVYELIAKIEKDKENAH